MRFSITTSLLASTATAFSDSSPFVLFSTSDNSQLQSTAQVLRTTHDLLASCPTSRYMLIAQPNLHASDLRDSLSGKCLAANLCAGSGDSNVRGRFDVAEVVGADLSMDDLDGYIKAACTEQGRRDVQLEHHQLDALPVVAGDARRAKADEMDQQLGEILRAAKAKAGDDYTVIYFSSPHELNLKMYESEFVESPLAQMELKRRSDIAEDFARRADGGKNSSAPLFVKYQFFTPGIFSGLVAGLVMIAMLVVGLKAVASLQVSYGAFDKEMGPAAQKKNM